MSKKISFRKFLFKNSSSDDALSMKRTKLQEGRRQNSFEAMKLIKENNEILGRLSKRPPGDSKTSPTDTKASQSTTSKSSQFVARSSPANKPITFNPFPTRQKKKPKEVGLKLGLYSSKWENRHSIVIMLKFWKEFKYRKKFRWNEICYFKVHQIHLFYAFRDEVELKLSL